MKDLSKHVLLCRVWGLQDADPEIVDRIEAQARSIHRWTILTNCFIGIMTVLCTANVACLLCVLPIVHWRSYVSVALTMIQSVFITLSFCYSLVGSQVSLLETYSKIGVKARTDDEVGQWTTARLELPRAVLTRRAAFYSFAGLGIIVLRTIFASFF